MNSYSQYDDYRMSFENQLYKIQIELAENARRWENINHLLVEGQVASQSGDPTVIDHSKNPLFKYLGLSGKDFKIDKNKVFILTPFIPFEEETYDSIRKVCASVNLNCLRGDEEYREGDLLSHIVRNIASARFVIANINGRSPNVYYELGICHAIGKEVIIVSNNKSELIFDVQGKNILLYSNANELEALLRNEMLKYFVKKENNQ